MVARRLFVMLFVFYILVGFQEGMPIKVMTDSIGKLLPGLRDCYHELKIGYTVKRLTEEIYDGSVRVGGLKVILLHMGTNSIDARKWQRFMTWQQRLGQIQDEFRQFYKAVRTFNGSAFIIFTSVLPRPCDWGTTKCLILALNRFLCQYARQTRSGYAPVFTSFVHKKDEKLFDAEGKEVGMFKKGDPIRNLFADRDGGLHLNLAGGYLFTKRIRDLLTTKELFVMADKAGFRIR